MLQQRYYSVSSTALQYSHMLTPYAAQFVREQLQKKDKCLLRDSGKLNSFAVDQNDCVLEVSQVDCSCQFRKSMLLPCSHIFAVRKKLSKDLFCATLCDIFLYGLPLYSSLV